MSPAAVGARLAEVARLSPLSLEAAPRLSLAPAEVEARLLELSEMSAVCLELAASGPPGRSPKLPDRAP